MSKMDTQNPKFRRYSSEQRRQMLIEAGLACLSRGGMLEFTIDKICAEADVSRGLITHHFKSKEGLLTAVYATMYERMVTLVVPSDVRLPDIVSMTNAMFDPRLFGRESVNVWLALWGEIANNAELMREHRRQYGAFRRAISAAIRRVAKARDRDVNPEQLATMFISLVDGLWLEQCVDPGQMSAKAARDSCFRMLEAFLGPLERNRKS